MTDEPVEAALTTLCNAVMADISEAKRRLDADIPKDAPVHPVSAFLTGTALHVGKARAALATPVASPMRPEDEAEAFIQAAVDRAPEPLRRLGEWLAGVLDEDDWKTAERMLLGAALTPPATPSPAPAAVEELVARLVKPLELVKPPGSETLRKAETLLGGAVVWTHHEAGGQWFWKLGSVASGSEATEADAEAMLRATYTARILSALDAAALSTLAADKARIEAERDKALRFMKEQFDMVFDGRKAAEARALAAETTLADREVATDAVPIAWKMLKPNGELHCFWHKDTLSAEVKALGYTAIPLYASPTPPAPAPEASDER